MKRQYEDEDAELDAIPKSVKPYRKGKRDLAEDLQPPTQHRSLQGPEPNASTWPKVEERQGANCATRPDAWPLMTQGDHVFGVEPLSTPILPTSGILERQVTTPNSWTLNQQNFPQNVSGFDSSLVALPITTTTAVCPQTGSGSWIASFDFQPHAAQFDGLTYTTGRLEVPQAPAIPHNHQQEIDISEHIHTLEQLSAPPMMPTASNIAHHGSSFLAIGANPVTDTWKTSEHEFQIPSRPETLVPSQATLGSDMAAGISPGQSSCAGPPNLAETSPSSEPPLSSSHGCVVDGSQRNPQLRNVGNAPPSVKQEEYHHNIKAEPSNSLTWCVPLSARIVSAVPAPINVEEQGSTAVRVNGLPAIQEVATIAGPRRGRKQKRVAPARNVPTCLRCCMQKIKVPQYNWLLFLSAELTYPVHTEPRGIEFALPWLSPLR